MTDEARESGFFVLSGACFEAERSIPYAPLLDLVRLFAGAASPAVVAHVLAPAAPELVTIFPELGPVLPDATPNPTINPETEQAPAVSRAGAGDYDPCSHTAGPHHL